MRKAITLILAMLLILTTISPFAAAEAPPKVLRFATSSLKGVFNPLLQDSAYDDYVSTLLFSKLCDNDPENNIVFDDNTIADRCDLSDDHLTYTFHLKEGLKFSNGEPLTASDVAFTYKMIAHPEYDGPRLSTVSDMLGFDAYKSGKSKVFEGIQVIDDKTISFTLVSPFVGKITEFATHGILSQSYYAKDKYQDFKALSAMPMGSGPFMIESYDPGQAFNCVRNPEWYGKRPKLDGVTILIVPEETQIMALASGQCDLIQAAIVNKDSYDALESAGLTVITFMGLGYNAMMLNHQSPKLADANVRKALMCGFDRQSFIDNEYDGFAMPCLTPIYPGFWAYPKDESELDPYAYDIGRAGKLLDEAGWVDIDGNGIREKDGVALALTLYVYNDLPWPGHLAALLKEQWALIGVELTVMTSDFNTVTDAAYVGRAFDKFDMWTQGWRMNNDPDMTELLGKDAYESSGGLNPGGYLNEESDALMREGRQEFDQAKRAEIFAKWAVVANDTLPMLFNAVPDEMWGVAPGVTGFEPMNPFYDWTSCILDVDIQ